MSGTVFRFFQPVCSPGGCHASVRARGSSSPSGAVFLVVHARGTAFGPDFVAPAHRAGATIFDIGVGGFQTRNPTENTSAGRP